MEIEFLKFYEISRDDLKGLVAGTLHVRFPELGLNLKGIYVIKKKDFFHVSLPNKKGFDKSLSKEVQYSTFHFDQKEKNDELIKVLKTRGREFILKYLNETPQISPQKLKKEQKPTKEPELKNTTAERKQTTLATRPVNATSIAKKVWMTPPPLKKRLPLSKSSRHG